MQNFDIKRVKVMGFEIWEVVEAYSHVINYVEVVDLV